MSIANGNWNEKDEKGIRTSTAAQVFLGRETLKRATRIAAAKGLALGGYLAATVRNAVNLDFEDLKQHENAWGSLENRPSITSNTPA